MLENTDKAIFAEDLIDEFEGSESRPSTEPVHISEDLWKTLETLPTPKDGNFKTLSKETPKHRAAFRYWVAFGDLRNDKIVADQFNVSPAAVGNWRKSFNWEGRYDYMQKEALQHQKKASARSLADDIRLLLGTLSLVQTKFIVQVGEGSTKISVQDFLNISDKIIELQEKLEILDPNSSSRQVLTELEASMTELSGVSKDLVLSVLKDSIERQAPEDRGIELQRYRSIQDQVDAAEAANKSNGRGNNHTSEDD